MYAQSQFARQIDHVAFFPPTPFVFEYFTEFDLAVELALVRISRRATRCRGQTSRFQRVIDRYQSPGGAA
jgi:hypothetical protein